MLLIKKRVIQLSEANITPTDVKHVTHTQDCIV